MVDVVLPDFMSVRSFQAAKRIVYGAKAIDRTGLEAKQLGLKNGLIVTDKTIEKTGLVEETRKSLENEGLKIDIFNKVEPEPRLDVADLVAETARGASYDFVVGVGGGSALDMAKVASIAMTNPDPIRQYLGLNKVKKDGVPKILIPTTAGTGSEVTNIAVVTLVDDEIKSGIVSPQLFADVAIVDPMTTITMPPRTTAGTGVDALSHAVEAIMSIQASPITDVLALEAVSRIGKSLRIAYYQGDNLKARYDMSLAALMAGLAFGSAGVAGGHAAAYAYSVKYDIAHGVSCGIALPHIMRYNMPVCEEKLVLIAKALDEETAGLPVREAACKAVTAVERLIQEVSLPTSLKSLGVPKADVATLAADMLKSERLLARQVRKITMDDAIELMKRICGE